MSQSPKPFVVIAGSDRVGKTSLITRYTSDKFDVKYEATLEKTSQITLHPSKGESITVDFADTAGNPEYKSMRDSYLSKGNIFIVVYSLVDSKTLQDAESILKQISTPEKSISKILVGNKSDLAEARQVTHDEGQNVAKTFHGFFFETSCQNGTNVNDLFKKAADLAQSYLDPPESEGGCCFIL